MEHKKLLKARKKVNIPNIAYQNQHIDTVKPHGSKDCVIVLDTVKTTFNLIQYTDKTSRIIKNIGRALARKKVLMLGSNEAHTINNSGTYDTYEDLKRKRT